MQRLLIVSPHFPPSSTADMHRVRMLLPYFRENGWHVEILAVEPDQIASPQDPWLADGLPEDVPVHRVRAMGLGWSRIPGLGTLGLRALCALAGKGDSLLERGQFDLVYFSTTVFEVHVLGPCWKRKYGVPFVMDYQDPWVNDYYRDHPEITPPGGRIKYALSNALHRWMEPRVLRDCAGITSVSPEYPKQLKARYHWLGDLPNLVQAFPGAKRDFERLSSSKSQQNVFDPNDGKVHWVYVGVVMPGMLPVIRQLFEILSLKEHSNLCSNLKFYFIGTSYASDEKARPQVLPLAQKFGLTNQITELTDRIPYVEALKCMIDADGLIAIGSDDPGYTASKIYPYLLAHKPMLAVFHEESSVVNLIKRVGGAVCVSFNNSTGKELAKNIANKWFDSDQYKTPAPLNENEFRGNTDQGCAEALCNFFHGLIDNKKSG